MGNFFDGFNKCSIVSKCTSKISKKKQSYKKKIRANINDGKFINNY